MSTEPLLIELGTEELPPKALKKLSEAFTKEILSGLLEVELIDEKQLQASSFATPRRLAILIPEVLDKQPDQTIERRGPAIQAAFKDDGEATPAAQGFAKSCGVEVADLERYKTDKGEWLSYTLEQVGKSTNDLVPAIIDQALKRLPIAKRMRWGDSSAEFVRPVKWLIVMQGDKVIPATVLNIQSSNTTRGHRFHSAGELTLKNATDYERLLEEDGKVIASFTKRQEQIKTQIETEAKKVKGKIEADQALLDEVTALVEHPTAILGEFDAEFLSVPQECLISSMRDHQKYFHLLDSNGKLMANFITVSNIQSKNPNRVKEGNERVLRARLADAKFFWQTDQKQKLESRIDKLSNVLFHVKLGSLFDKSQRIKTLAGIIAKQINADKRIAERGALLSKADLVSDMVNEFDELQGVMGHYYADLDGEDKLIGECIEQHYWPKFAGDQLPTSVEAQAVALADKLDSLVGLFGAGESSTGDKDPYALRRAALSILRILIEKQLPLNLSELVAKSAKVFAQHQSFKIDQTAQSQIIDFIRSRLMSYYQNQKIATNTIHAVMACKPDSPLDFENRLKAVNEFGKTDEANDLVAANKRISNILKKQKGEVSDSVDQSVLVEEAEKQLNIAIDKIQEDCVSLFDKGDYNLGLTKLATLHTPVDDFFENVMVMSEDPKQQANRLALLKKMQLLFLRVADISLLQS